MQRRENTQKTTAQKLQVIRGVDTQDRSKSSISICNPSLHSVDVSKMNQDSIEQQALQGCAVSKQMRTCDIINMGVWRLNCSNGFAVPESTILHCMVIQQK
jgi:hypothetical protein